MTKEDNKPTLEKTFNIKSTTAEKGIDIIKEIFQSLLKPTTDELGLLLSEPIRRKRLLNQLNTFKMIKAIVDEKHINPKSINLKVFYPFVEAISLEEEEPLQKLWANLFINYIDASKNLIVNVYPEVLRQLSTNEVELIWYMRGNNNFTGFGRALSGIHFIDMCTNEHIGNLERLGIIVNSMLDGGGAYIRDDSPENFRDNSYKLTQFGISFVDACSR